MAKDANKIKAQMEKAQALARKNARKVQALASELSRVSRTEDTRRKILAGSWALDEAEKSPEFREKMMRALDRAWLSRDDDRRLFGFELLDDDEKSRRDLAPAKARVKKDAVGEAPAPLSGGSADASRYAISQRETEAA